MTKTPFNLSRRGMIKTAAALGVITPAFAGAGSLAMADNSFQAKLGSITVTKRGPATIHTYMAGNKSALVTSHIIETDKGLYLVDCQFLNGFAAEFRAYADSLGKPIKQVHLSHPHPDHFSGYAKNFADVDFVSTKKVVDTMDERWVKSGRIKGLQKIFKDQAAEKFVLPEASVTSGKSNWGGLEVDILEYADAEAKAHTVVHIREAQTLIVQDLAYSNAHFFPLGQNENWITVVDALAKISDVDLVLCGHGLPAGRGVFDDSQAYLKFLALTLKDKKTAEEAIMAMKDQYPNYGAEGILNFIGRLYKKDH